MKRSARLTQCLEIQSARAKAEGIIYKLINDMHPPSKLDGVKKRQCQVFIPLTTKGNAATQMNSRPQTANETL